MTESSYHILLVEDNPGDALLLEDMLLDAPVISFDIDVVERCDAAIEALSQKVYDVILLDLSLPDSHGIETVERIRTINTETPLIVLTGLSDEAVGLATLQAGAQDYLIKNELETHLVVRAIRFAIERQRAEQATRDWELTRMELLKEREISDLKSQFITLVSHEFRTPLTIINTSSELLERYGDKLSVEKRNKHLGNIRESIQHITGLLDDVVLAGNVQTGTIRIEYQSFDLQQYLQEIIQTFQNSIHPTQNILFLPVGNHEKVISDKHLLHEIVWNLLTNAVAYSPPESKIMIQLKTGEESSMIQVSDQGIGIPKEDQERIYNVFYRGSNISNRSGTGLGLYIAKHCLDLLGGAIQFESEQKKGTTFYVTVPNSPEPSV